jgi:anthranilate synthase/aminodeoxychorismate synthase-like glutamine amidotransferase
MKLLRALLIDHDDSFTQNVRSWLSEQFEITLIHHKKIADDHNQLNYDLIVLSPGPKSALDYPDSLKFLSEVSHSQPILGICLGMQMMTLACDGAVKTYKPPRHGKTSQLDSKDQKINGLTVGRYHSLACHLKDNTFQVIASSESLPMWIQHTSKKWMGFQFHPESFLTENPEVYLNHICDWIKK